jgi:putative ABC transport system permease protein
LVRRHLPSLPVRGPDKIKSGTLSNLEAENAITADFYDAAVYDMQPEVGVQLEINGKRAVIDAITDNLRGFAGNTVYTTLERANYYGNRSGTAISAVIVNVKPGYDPARVRDEINQHMYGVRAWIRRDFSRSTIAYTLGSTGIGASTGTLIVFAIISGFFIIGLTMYSSALDRIRDYGTLKAIGASNGYVRRLILTQAAVFAVVGFVIAYSLLEGFRMGVKSSGLTFEFNWQVKLGMFAITLFIALFGAIFALRRINGVELGPCSRVIVHFKISRSYEFIPIHLPIPGHLYPPDSTHGDGQRAYPGSERAHAGAGTEICTGKSAFGAGVQD